METPIEVQGRPVRALAPELRNLLRNMTAYPDSFMVSVIDDNPAAARCWVAQSARRVAGWSLLRWFEPRIEAPHDAYISVYVTPSARGRGLGRRLVQSAMAHGKQKALRPCYYGATAGQRKFYSSCGAPECSITPDAFPRTYWAHCRFV